MSSKYWDDFERRILETVDGITKRKPIPIRRVAVFITNKCNFSCDYCNMSPDGKELSEKKFNKIVGKYGKSAIIHITGGEPSTVKWLYDYIDCSLRTRFHLNSNLLLKPPKNIQRLKVSLDTNYPDYFDSLVNFNGAFNKVVTNIKKACEYTTVSITCTLTKENFNNAPYFMAWCKKEFPDLYAVFFSVYKGTNERFKFDSFSANRFFTVIKPQLEKEMDKESYSLLQETIDEKFRIIQGVRFPENRIDIPCYISMSERVVDWDGNEAKCSHLFRDGIIQTDSEKHKKCLYGCNRRLVHFNEAVQKGIS